MHTSIYSTLANEPGFDELVDWYVSEIPERIALLENAFANRDWELLRRTAHQMKGAAGSYGFDPITPVAFALESAVKQQSPEEGIADALRDLVDLCRCIRAGTPQ